MTEAPDSAARLVQATRLRQSLVLYLDAKVLAQDWHGVADAAMDLREVDARIAALEGRP